MLYIKNNFPVIQVLFNIGAICLLGFLSVAIFYWTASQRFYSKANRKFFVLFPAFLIVSMGLSLHNSIAVIEGWLGIKTPFVRTPKFNIVGKRDQWLDNAYLNPNLTLITLLEGFMCVCFIFGMVKGFQMNDPTLLIFHAMLALGFGTVFLLSIKPWANA
jgi:hypothetical protein